LGAIAILLGGQRGDDEMISDKGRAWSRILTACVLAWGIHEIVAATPAARADWLEDLKQAATQPVRDVVDETKREIRDEVHTTTEEATRDPKDVAQQTVDCTRRGSCPEKPTVDGSDAAVEEPAAPAAVSARGPAVDVIGIRLGMTPDAVRAVLETREVEFRGQKVRHRVETWKRTHPTDYVGDLKSTAPLAVPVADAAGSPVLGELAGGLAPDGTVQFTPELVTASFVSPLGGNGAAMVRYVRGFLDPPPLEATEQRLLDKYGAPGLRTAAGGTTLEWAWDPEGRPLELVSAYRQDPPGRVCLPGHGSGALPAASPGCGRAMRVKIQARQGFVDWVEIVQIDHALLGADATANRDAQRRRQQKVDQERRDRAVVPTF
jgi:hypothetical protein